MSRYCLDTSAYSHFMRGQPAIVEILDRAEWVGVPTVTIGELRAGFMLGGRNRTNEEELAAFLLHAGVESVPVDEEVSRHYAEIVVDLRAAGTPIPTNDIWIGASAARVGALVLTFDRHFEKIRRVGSVVLEP